MSACYRGHFSEIARRRGITIDFVDAKEWKRGNGASTADCNPPDLASAMGKLQAQSEARKAKFKPIQKCWKARLKIFWSSIVSAENSSVVGAYEKRIAALDRKRLVMAEKLTDSGQGFKPFDELFQLAMQFVASPATLWDTGRIELRQTVLKLAFLERPAYSRKGGFRTPAIAYPFRLLGQLSRGESLLAVDVSVIEPLLPPPGRGPKRKDDRRILNGIFYILRTGAPWRDLPEWYGPRTTVYNRYAKWGERDV